MEGLDSIENSEHNPDKYLPFKTDKPVFFKHSTLLHKNTIREFEVAQAAIQVIGDSVQGVKVKIIPNSNYFIMCFPCLNTYFMYVCFHLDIFQFCSLLLSHIEIAKLTSIYVVFSNLKSTLIYMVCFYYSILIAIELCTPCL